jgi:hypothetical protein
MKLVIAISKKVNLHGHNVRGFRYVVEFGLHVYEGRALDVEEFNKISKDVFHQNASLYPYALVVGAGEGVADDKLAEENKGLKAELDMLKASLNPVGPAVVLPPVKRKGAKA